MNNTITCPKCGNVQQEGSDRCLKCGFQLSSFMNYLESVNDEINKSSKKKNNFYEISPQWQQYVDRQNGKSKHGGKIKRVLLNPLFIGFLIILGFSIKYFLDNGLLSKENNKRTETEQNRTVSVDNQSNTTKASSSDSKNTSSLSFEAQNAYRSAQDYLNFMAFSKKGLIAQLKVEGYSEESATAAVNSLNIDWKEQAAKSAKEYLDFMALSRKQLLSQLKLEGFTDEQAEYGVKAVGYD